jgi:3-deoxy-manno-octulosonate cytidylyltransferase (CMP-KDO synthetase)
MSVLLVIPARYESSRFPGKPLAELRGATGISKSLIERSWRTAKTIQGVDDVVVATDDDRISKAAEAFGAKVVMTSPECRNGTERCAEAVHNLGSDAKTIVNFQGDAPLTPPWFVEALISAILESDAALTTPVLRCDAAAMRGFLEDRKAGRVGGTTAVFDTNGRALYFSKEVLPYTGRTVEDPETVPVFHHVGVYAYRREALLSYPDLAPGPLETWEGLEQLRFMEHGQTVQCTEVDAKGRSFWELNNPEDIPRLEEILRERGED